MSSPTPSLKRKRSTEEATPPSSPLSSLGTSQRTDTQPTSSPAPALRTLPPAELLLALPGVLVHPPTHALHVPGLALSLLACRQCLALPGLAPEQDVRAHTAFVELGARVLESGAQRDPEQAWAHNLESEIEVSLSKGILISSRHPALRGYFLHLTLLHAQHAHGVQHNAKLARKTLQRLLSSAQPGDPPHHAYEAQLLLVAHHLAAPSDADVDAALRVVDDLRRRAGERAHADVCTLAYVMRVRVLVTAGRWDVLGSALEAAEAALGLSYPDPPPKSSQTQTQPEHEPLSAAPPARTPPSPETPFAKTMSVMILMLGTLFHTHAGAADAAAMRLADLHALLDAGALDAAPCGFVSVDIPGELPLVVSTPPARQLLLLAYEVSAAAKRDAAGRNPKRRVFAAEGARMCDAEARTPPLLPAWAGAADAAELDERLARVRAALEAEMAEMAIMRSEFDVAEEHLNVLIAYTRTHGLFPHYAPRIALLHAHLAHALHNAPRAGRCYAIAAALAKAGSEIHASALAGAAALDIGLAAEEGRAPDEDTRKRVKEAARACRGNGTALDAIAELLESVLASSASPAHTPAAGAPAHEGGSIVLAKRFLKQALDRATRARDNQLRALVLALVGAHYVHTAGAEAAAMLRSARQLAASLGAPAARGQGDAVGNAVLGQSVGERYLELYRRAGDEASARKQASANTRLARAVDQLKERGRALDRPAVTEDDSAT